MARIAEISLVSLLLILAGVAIAAPGFAVEQRVSAIVAIVSVLAGLVLVGLKSR